MPNNGAPHFMTRNPNFDVQFKHNFMVYIEGMDEIITLSTNSFPLPNITIAEEEVAFGNQSMYLAGKATVDGGDFICNDYVEPDVEMLLWDWFKKVYDPETGVRGKQADYKKTATVVLLEGDMQTARGSWKIEGVWPTAYNAGGDMSYEDATKKQITLTLKFDNGYPIR